MDSSALADISNSPAYAHLDELAANGHLSEAQYEVSGRTLSQCMMN